MSDEVVKCGLIFEPPTLLLLYRRGGLLGRTRKRTVPLSGELAVTDDAASSHEVAERLKQDKRHGELVRQLSQLQLERLLAIVRDVTVGRMTKEESLARQRQMERIDPLEDLNKVDEETLQRKKAAMQAEFEQHQLRPGDPGYVYDKEVDFGNGASIEHCEWDSEDDPSGF